MHNHNLRAELVEEVDEFQAGLKEFAIFKAIRKGWAKLTKWCQPLFRFHDKYIMYVLWAILLVGTACVVAYVSF